MVLAAGDASVAIAAARSQLGVPYKWAWEKPGQGFDCSGLTQWSYAQAGVKIPRVTTLQVLKGDKVAKADLQPGDLVFPQAPIHHVQIYTGNGMIIEAPETGKNVREVPMWGFFTARRIVANSGNTTQSFAIPSAGNVATSGALGGVLGIPSFNDLFKDSRHFALRGIEVILGLALILVGAAQISIPKVQKLMNAPVIKTAVKAIK